MFLKLNFLTKTQLILGFSFFIIISSYSQKNLVPNPSFEQYTNCPFNRNLAEELNTFPNFWFKPDRRFSAFINACSNDSIHGGVPMHKTNGGIAFQYARTGVGYITNYHAGTSLASSYFEVKLIDSLKKGKRYYGECFVNLMNVNITACNNQSMYFSNQAVYVDTVNCDTLFRNPQIKSYANDVITDTVNWVKISGIFTAEGGEQYLTLGNFRKVSETKRVKFQNTGISGSVYYYDDVAVYELDSFCLPADAGRDTTIKPNDSVFIGSYTDGIDTIKWYNASGQVIDSVQPGFWVKPNATGSYRYIVEQVVNGCYSKDTVYVNVILPLRMLSLTLNPSPTERDFIVAKWITANEVNVSHQNIQRSNDGKTFETIGTVKALNNSYNEYSFIDELKTNTQYPTPLYYRIESIDKDGRKQYSAIKTVTINHSSLNVTIYPNPAKDLVNIYCKEGIKEVKLINTLGQIVKQQMFSNPVNSLPWRVGEAKGLYILQINNSNYVKLIIE